MTTGIRTFVRGEVPNGLTSEEIAKVVYRYIGVSDGYLRGFSYASLAQFYPLYCNLDIDPNVYPPPTRERFISVLKSQNPADQAKILRGLLKRCPVDEAYAPETRTQVLKSEIEVMIARLEQNAPVANPSPQITSDTVDQAIADAETLLKTSGAASAVDRMHTALHGHLRAVCDQSGISYDKEDTIARLLKILRENHPAFQIAGVRDQDTAKILGSFGAVSDALNSIRNNATLAHPNPTLLEEAEAMLAINAARTILQYLDAKFKS